MDKENYRIFSPETFNSIDRNVLKILKKMEKKDWYKPLRSLTASLTPVILYEKQSVIQMLVMHYHYHLCLLVILLKYLVDVVVQRKRRDIANIH